MIVSTDGAVLSRSEPEAKVSGIFCTTGQAYRKKSVVKTIIRFFRNVKNKIKKRVAVVKDFCYSLKFVFATKSGKPNAIEPPIQPRNS